MDIMSRLSSSSLPSLAHSSDSLPVNDRNYAPPEYESELYADVYLESLPSLSQSLRTLIPSGRDVWNYISGLFAFLHWIGRYNMQWFAGDFVAGATVGAVVVPQCMAYAHLAHLPPEFGLYSSFVGVLIYWFFATSKDITIGPVAVLSILTGNLVQHAQTKLPDYAPFIIATTAAFLSGIIILALGLLRLGWLVEFISLPATSAFMTGSAVTIAINQLSPLLGIKRSGRTHESALFMLISLFRNIKTARIDAAIGVSTLVLLYGIRFACGALGSRFPRHSKLFFFLSTLRTVFAIGLFTLVGWLVNRNRHGHPLFRIVGHVPSGFRHIAVPTLNSELISAISPNLTVTVIVALIEHISIAKSFGRLNKYRIDPSQELVAIGMTNFLGAFLGGFAATGSFSRTAIKSKAGVRTPFAGVITAIIVLLAIYVLASVFFYIPSASLAGVIIHAIGDVITNPRTIRSYWRISPLDFIIFVFGVIVSLVTSIENGIYATVISSVAHLLFRVSQARGHFLGCVEVQPVTVDGFLPDGKVRLKQRFAPRTMEVSHQIYLPFNHSDNTNPQVLVNTVYPGVYIYQFTEGFIYANASRHLENMFQGIQRETRASQEPCLKRQGDRLWNSYYQDKQLNSNSSPTAHDEEAPPVEKSTLRAIILDFSRVGHIDMTSIQNLVDMRSQVDSYTNPSKVSWHFVNVGNAWMKRALLEAGFGYPDGYNMNKFNDEAIVNWKGTYYSTYNKCEEKSHAELSEKIDFRIIGEINSHENPKSTPTLEDNPSDESKTASENSRSTLSNGKLINSSHKSTILLRGINLPCFHMDLESAVHNAISIVQEEEMMKS